MVIKSRKIKRDEAGSKRGQIINANKSFYGIPEGNRPLRRRNQF
jgi:hypothetical protein